jgi:glycosyltransferase involved in cell wall biosynthesis
MRDSVDVIIPFAGSREAFTEIMWRLGSLELGPEDSLTLVDNSPRAVADAPPQSPSWRVVGAHERQSSYFARNRGAAGRRGTWLLFLDADVVPAPDLIERYLAVPPGSRTGFLVGAVRDAPSLGGQQESIASRYSQLRRLIDQTNTLQMHRPYAKTANCLVRRSAFEEVGGFVDDVRSGGDADLCFRLQRARWDFELRPNAVGEHRSRRRVVALLAQRLRHGSGAEWLERRYVGFVGPRRSMLRVGRSIVGGTVRSVASYCRGDTDRAILDLLDPLSNAAFEVGRRIPNAPWRELSRHPHSPPYRWMLAARESRGGAE